MRTSIRFGLIATGVATLHYALEWTCFLAGFSLGMSDFDDGPTIWGTLGKILFAAAQALWWPLGTHAMRSDMSPIQQHLMFAANSMCWGILGAVAANVYGTRKRRTT